MGPAARTGPINLAHSQRKLSFFTSPSELKYNHNCNIVLPSVAKVIIQSVQTGMGGGVGWQWIFGRKVSGVMYFRLDENGC